MNNMYGLINEQPKLQDWELGGLTPLELKLSNPEGDWSSFLPVDEFQNRWGYDRMACVAYSAINCLEILYKYQTGTERNFSDRFIAKMSNTTPQGNSMSWVWDCIRNNGLIDEYRWPDVKGGWDEYYKEIPQEIKNEAKEILNNWLIYREWVRTDRRDDIYLALKSAPLQVSVRYAEGSGLLNPNGAWNHVVTCYHAEKGKWWDIFDHYSQTRKRYDWSYEFGAIIKPSLIKKTNNIMTIKNNTLLQLIQGKGGFGLFLDDKIIVDDLSLVTASWLVRNKGNIKDMVMPVTLETWDKYDKINLKGE